MKDQETEISAASSRVPHTYSTYLTVLITQLTGDVTYSTRCYAEWISGVEHGGRYNGDVIDRVVLCHRHDVTGDRRLRPRRVLP